MSIIAIAQNLGIFANNGLKVTATILPSNVGATGLATGSLSFYTYFGTLGFLQASQGQASLVAVAMGTPRGSPFFLMVNPSITSPQQLIGKTVATNTPNGNPSTVALKYILGTLGLNDSQINLSFFSTTNVALQALLAGQVSAAIISPPRNLLAANNGFKQMGPASTQTAYNDPDLLASSQSFVSNHPAIVKAYLQSLIEAQRDLYWTMQILNGTTPAHMTPGFNATEVLSSISGFTGFNTTLAKQAVALYYSLGLLDLPFLPDNTTWNAAYYRDISTQPSLQSVNITSALNYNIIKELNAPCGYVYSLYGYQPPTPN